MLFGIEGIRNASNSVLSVIDLKTDGTMVLRKEASEFFIGALTLLFLISYVVHYSGSGLVSPRLPKQISERSYFRVFRWFWALFCC